MVRFRSAAVSAVAAALLAAGSAAPARAAFDASNIQSWVGSGSSSAVLVIDWHDGTALAWGYRFDGSPTAYQMLTDIAAADSRVYLKIDSQTPYGSQLYGVGFDGNGDGLAISDAAQTAFTNRISDQNVSAASFDADHVVDGAAATDPADHWAEGWNSSFWSEWLATSSPYSGGSWDFGFGLSFDTLTDGAWIGLVYEPDFGTSDAPVQPLAVTATAVPEPTAAGLLLAAASTLGLIRRR